ANLTVDQVLKRRSELLTTFGLNVISVRPEPGAVVIAIEREAQRLGIKARAAGIYLVFAAQRPDANVMPMQLRANLGNRLVLRVDGEGTSEIALGEKGAERLLGKGHLAAKLEGSPEIIFGQVPFVDSDFLSQVVETLKQN